MTWFGIILRHLRRTWAMLLVFSALVTIVFIHREGERLAVRVPYVYLGDEPHYLTNINSVLWDGDVEVGNNYARGGLGHVDSGSHRAGQLIDHHTYVHTFSGIVYQQISLFGSFGDRADRDAAGRPRPIVREIPKSGILPTEDSWHPSYPFFLAAPFLSLLPRTAVEPVIICLIAAFSFWAALRFRELCTVFVPSRLYADLAMLAVFVGTPVFYYSRSLFPESIFVILVVFACHGCIVQRRWLVPGLCLLLAAALKPPAALLAVPVILLLASMALWKAVAVFGLVCLGAGFSFFELRFLKGVLQSGTVVDADRILHLATLGYMPYANLFHPRYGLFVFAPVLALALVGWVPLARRFPKQAGALLAGVVLNFGFLCLIWFYGSSYGGRYQVPFIPFLGLGLVGIWFYGSAARRVLLVVFAVLLLISMAINLQGALWST